MVTLGPWVKGMNNRVADHALPTGTRQDPSAACRNAVNVDFDNTGKPKRRDGLALVCSGVDMKSGYGCPLGEFLIEGIDLKTFNSDNTSTTIYAGLTGTEFAFSHFNDTVYFSDGVISRKIIDGTVTRWGMEVPEAPVLSGTSGSYGLGSYLATICWVDSRGVESGASEIVSVDVGGDSGIIFNALPVTTDPQIAYLRLYLSTANGKELYHVADVSVGTLTYSVLAGRYDEGNILENQFVSPAPAGRIIRFYKGRAYIADDSGTIYYSEPFSFDQFKLSENFIQFPDAVDVMEPVESGLFIAYGKQTDFYAGTPEEGFSIVKKFNYGGVFGTGGSVPNSDDVTWQSQRGMVLGTPAGQCENIQEGNVAVESAVSGATLIREKDGLRQFIASLKQPTASPLAATSWIDAEVIRRR
jgi:hypothetical protein